jgi:hypothetical protein
MGSMTDKQTKEVEGHIKDASREEYKCKLTILKEQYSVILGEKRRHLADAAHCDKGLNNVELRLIELVKGGLMHNGR